MQIAVFRRAAVVIVLLVAMFAPLGTCLQSQHQTKHSCCAPPSESSKAGQKDCCKVSTPLPAIVAAPSLVNLAPTVVKQAVVLSNGLASTYEFSVTAFALPHSPPSGAFNLRI
jgi:hypothetical protein